MMIFSFINTDKIFRLQARQIGATKMAKIHGGRKFFQVGEKVPKPGQYILVNEKGEKQKFTIYLAEGEAFPKQRGDDYFYVLEDDETASFC